MHSCMHACMHARTHACTHACMHACIEAGANAEPPVAIASLAVLKALVVAHRAEIRSCADPTTQASSYRRGVDLPCSMCRDSPEVRLGAQGPMNSWCASWVRLQCAVSHAAAQCASTGVCGGWNVVTRAYLARAVQPLTHLCGSAEYLRAPAKRARAPQELKELLNAAGEKDLWRESCRKGGALRSALFSLSARHPKDGLARALRRSAAALCRCTSPSLLVI